MISWISNLIQKRGKIIFSVLLFIIIIAFVFTIGAGPGLVSSDKANYQREFYGVDLNSAGDMQVLQNSTMVSRYVNGVRQYDENQFQQQMLYRQVRLYLAEQLSIPNPNESELAEFIKTKPAFMDTTGKFDQTAFETFVTSLKGGASINDAFVAQTIKDDYRLQQLDLLMSAPGFVSENEVTAAIAREKTSWDLEIAKIDYKDFSAEIDANDEVVGEFFNNSQFRYEIPEEYTISFVEFSADNVKTPVQHPGDEELQNYFLTNRSKFADAEKALTPEPVEGEEAADEESLSPLDIYAKIKVQVFKTYSDEQKTGEAVVLANEFTGKLFDEEIPFQSIEFKKELIEHGLKMKSVPPFSKRPETQMVGVVPQELYTNAMRLGDDRYFTDVIPNRDDTKFLVGFLESQTASRIPALEEVKAQVVADYKADQKAKKFSEHGIALATSIRGKLEAGEAFKAVVEAETLAYEDPEAFKLTEQPESVPFQVLQSIEGLKKGEITDMLTVSDTGYFVYVTEATIPETEEEDSNIDSIEKGLNNYAGMTRYQALIENMIAKKLNPGA